MEIKRNRVGAEHLGQARLFRQAVIDDELVIEPELLKLILRLQKRLQKKRTIRHPSRVDVVRRWRDFPARFRLAFNTGQDVSSDLTIEEIRLGCVQLKFSEWIEPEWEPGVAIMRLTMSTAGMVRFVSQPLVVLSLHCLARYIERTGNRSHDKLVRDIAPLAAVDADTDHVPCPSGVWLGERAITACGYNKTFKVRAVRTFVSEAGRRVVLPLPRLNINSAPTRKPPDYTTDIAG